MDPALILISELYQAARQTSAEEFAGLIAAFRARVPGDEAPHRSTDSQSPASVPAAESNSLLLAHMEEAMRINRLLLARGQGNRPQRAGPAAASHRAIADERGQLVYCGRELRLLLSEEVPGWTGRVLPTPWLNQVLGRGLRVAGGAVRLSGVRLYGSILLAAKPTERAEGLSGRERAVALAYTGGKTYRTIAAQSGLSTATVRNCIQRIYRKLGISNKVELAMLVDRRRVHGP